MKIIVYLLSSFGKDTSGGNPAGVVLNADRLTDFQKKAIAKKVGVSETAFIQKSDKANFKVTFFTPVEEVDLCGHATIATYALLLKEGIIKVGEYTQELKAGILKVNVSRNGIIAMDQTLPKFKNVIETVAVANILKIPVKWITSTEFMPRVVSTGLNDLIIPIDTREHLFSIEPDDKSIADFETEHGLDSFHIFTFDTIESNSTAHSRNFDPLHGIHEESATGSSTGALACYLYKNGKIHSKELHKLLFEQGYSMKKPSLIAVSLGTVGQEITKVQVCGKALLTGKKTIEL
jgi:PhzF family phenazine biosynthesis protein